MPTQCRHRALAACVQQPGLGIDGISALAQFEVQTRPAKRSGFADRAEGHPENRTIPGATLRTDVPAPAAKSTPLRKVVVWNSGSTTRPKCSVTFATTGGASSPRRDANPEAGIPASPPSARAPSVRIVSSSACAACSSSSNRRRSLFRSLRSRTRISPFPLRSVSSSAASRVSRAPPSSRSRTARLAWPCKASRRLRSSPKRATSLASWRTRTRSMFARESRSGSDVAEKTTRTGPISPPR